MIGDGSIYLTAVAFQVGVLVAALLAPVLPMRPLLVARYYVLTTAVAGRRPLGLDVGTGLGGLGAGRGNALIDAQADARRR